MLRLIQRAANEAGLSWELERQGASHEIWRLADVRVIVPRHREISGLTARRILKELEPMLGKDWWRR
jgi:mRNA interferase HicA